MRHSTKNHSLPYWAAGVSIAVFAILGITAAMNRTAHTDNRGCLDAVTAKTVFVIDQSEEISSQTRAEILSRIRKIVNEKVSVGELVSVFSVTDLSKKNLKPLFSYCKPAKEAHGPAESQRFITAKYTKNFEKPLERVVDSPVTGSKQSPIAQAIIDLSLSDYMRSKSNSRLVIFSDFLEYTERFQLYGCHDSKGAIANFRTSRGAAVARPTFNSTDIQLHIIPRLKIMPSVGKCRDEFWLWFFTDNEGKGAAFNQNYLPG